jgi:multidrug efflux system outer membrane protein
MMRPFPGPKPAAAARRATPHLALLAVAWLAAACSTLAPAPTTTPGLPVPPVATAYPAQPAGGEGRRAADTAWQDFFTDARLERLIDLALDQNRDLRVAVLAIEQARAQLQLRRADEQPTVGIGVNASRVPGSNGGIASSYSAGLQLSAYEFDFFGRLRSLSDAARAQLVATEEARKTVQISLVAAVAQAHLALQADEALLAVTRQTLATREESYRLSRLKFDNGVSSELDLRQAESLLEAARVALAQQTRQRALDENALVLLIGQPLPADLPPLAPLGAGSSLPELPAGLPSELLARRPDIRQAEQLLRAADANITAARAAFFPRISLTTSVGLASRELSALFSGGNLAWSFAPQLLAPLFDAGRNQANLEAASLAREVAVARYEKAIQTAFREVSDALAGRATLGEQLRAQQAQARASEASLRLADLRYRQGVSSFLELLDAQRAVFAAQQAVVQVQALQVQNQVLMYQVLGGGWTPPADAPR